MEYLPNRWDILAAGRLDHLLLGLHFNLSNTYPALDLTLIYISLNLASVLNDVTAKTSKQDIDFQNKLIHPWPFKLLN